MHIAILTDFTVTTFATGPAFSTQTLKRYLEARGHKVTIVGPTPGKGEPDAPPGSLLFWSLPFRGHPGMQFPFPWPASAMDNSQKFDVIHSHANSLLMHWGPLMRKTHGVPCIATNTIYLPAWAQHVLPESIYKNEKLRTIWSGFARTFERKFANTYNQGDGLIVQCATLANYWREVGTLTVPLHVIPRPIDSAMWDRPVGSDPVRPTFARGKRLVCACRHAREKDVDKIIKAFAEVVLPAHPDASLTLIGDGQEHVKLQALVHKLGLTDRIDFAGERPQRDMRDFYAHTDVFVYASVTETYGQVVSEALWCGVPVVAIDDNMGVAFQCKSGEDSVLVAKGQGDLARLGQAVADVLTDHERRKQLGARAASRARERVPPEVVYAQYEHAYQVAIDHLKAHPPAPYSGTFGQKWTLWWAHVWPWIWQHIGVVVLGFVRGNKTYQLPKVLNLDKLPSELK